uniref:Uncharacterized protein n=1 Tax=Kalanchoe fedtschenkoi TaxID=63787 RepID=A0A7N1A2D7_KALFE
MEPKTRFWEWKGKPKTRDSEFPVTKFIRGYGRKTEEESTLILGPGYGVGVGCGVGFGVGLVGGAGFGGWPWNHLNIAFGLGFGCGVGLGVGYGQGMGYGNSWNALSARVSDRRSGNGKRIVVEI